MGTTRIDGVVGLASLVIKPRDSFMGADRTSSRAALLGQLGGLGDLPESLDAWCTQSEANKEAGRGTIDEADGASVLLDDVTGDREAEPKSSSSI